MCDYLVYYPPISQEFNQNQLEVDPNYQNVSAMPSKIVYVPDSNQTGGFCFMKPERKKERSSGDSRKSKKSLNSKKSSKIDSTGKSGSTSPMTIKSEWSSSMPVKISSSSRKPSSTSRYTLEGKKTYTLIPSPQAVNWKSCQPIYLNCEQLKEVSQSTDCESVQQPMKISKYPCYQSTDPNRHLVDPKELNLCEQNVECEPPKASKPVYQFRCKKVSYQLIYFLEFS